MPLLVDAEDAEDSCNYHCNPAVDKGKKMFLFIFTFCSVKKLLFVLHAHSLFQHRGRLLRQIGFNKYVQINLYADIR